MKLNHYLECKNIIWSSWTQTLCNFIPQQFSSKSFFLSADWSKVCAEYFMWPIIRGLRYQLSIEPHDQFWSMIGCLMVGRSEWHRSEAAVPRRHCPCVWKLEGQPSTTPLILTAERQREERYQENITFIYIKYNVKCISNDSNRLYS